MSEVVERLLKIISDMEKEDRKAEVEKNNIDYTKEFRRYCVIATIILIWYITFVYGLFSYNGYIILFGIIGIIVTFIVLYSQSKDLRKTNNEYTSSEAHMKRAKRIPEKIDIEMTRENIDLLLSELFQVENQRKETRNWILSTIGKLVVIVLLSPSTAFLTAVITHSKVNEKTIQIYILVLIAMFVAALGVVYFATLFLFGDPLFGKRYKLWNLERYLKNLRYYTSTNTNINSLRGKVRRRYK